MRPGLAIFAAVLALAVPGAAEPARLVADISEHEIAITSSFQGTELLIFGAIQAGGEPPSIESGPGDVVVAVRGPETPVIVRRKNRMAGIWVNDAELTFEGVPGYYAVAATRPLDEIAGPTLLARHALGFRHLNFSAPDAAQIGDAGDFRRAVIRRRRESGLFSADEGGVRVLGEALFRATLTFPANVPLGRYEIAVYLFRDGDVISRETTTLSVDKSGIERRIYLLARQAPLIYGVGAVVLAVAAGWLGAALFRTR